MRALRSLTLLALTLGAATAAAQPCPPDRAPCAAACCAPGEACRADACHAPMASCASDADCPPDAFCDPLVEACYTAADLPACEFRPPVGRFDPIVRWAWGDPAVEPTYRNVMMTPVVVQLTDDDGDGDIDHRDIPDVVFSTYVGGGSHAEEGILRAVSGADGTPIFDVLDPTRRVNGLGAIAAGDIDGDGIVEIVTSQFRGRGVWESGLQAFEHDGTPKWATAEAWSIGWGGPALADLDGDGAVEVIAGRVVIEGATGARRCQAQGAGGQGDHDLRRPLSFAADLDGDGRQEIVAGNAVYDADCGTVWADANELDGFPAVADFDGDGDPEIVVVYNGGVRLVDHTGRVLARAAVPGAGDPGGPPTIADFDGDGRLEFATAGSTRYVVLKPDAALDGIDILWSAITQDASSRVTGSSVFDFEGDGQAEVVYGDECWLRVYRGADGFVLAEIPNPSATTYEYPVIVDVDNDGRAEIIAVSNGAGGGCAWARDPALNVPPFTTPGVRVFGDRLGNWVGTRAIWNQHAYAVTHVCDGTGDACQGAEDISGGIPRRPIPHWQLPWANSFRQNVQGSGVFATPDLVPARVRATALGCPPVIEITFVFFNQGSEAVPAGVAVTLYGPGGDPIATTRTTRRLEPGQGEPLAFRDDQLGIRHLGQPLELVLAVDDDAGFAAWQECHEGNNAARITLDIPADGGVEPTPCATGAPGICAEGTRVCVAGVEGCQPLAEARPERCNGLDDDCDGRVDEALRGQCGRCGDDPADGCNGIDDDCDDAIDEDAMCLPYQLCIAGVCANGCVNGECPSEREQCVNGFCLDRCLETDCPPGHPCASGQCFDPCEDMQCPAGEVCARGACGPDTCAHAGCPDGERCAPDGCVPDACAAVDCARGTFCRDGACVASCATISCALGQSCADGACLPDPCHGVTCAAGERCRDGTCHPEDCGDCPEGTICRDGCVEDPCRAVDCPPAERCVLDSRGVAQCLYEPLPDLGPEPPDAAAPDAAAPDLGLDPDRDGGGIEDRDDGICIPGSPCDPGEPDAGEITADPISDGCACRADAAGDPRALALLIAALALTRRRRR
ncbi:MAG: VCBS repeat-containing protein [Myxococcales bacterium]|nr:VCBS repeat-containing protein [Myxococcales bacterium]